MVEAIGIAIISALTAAAPALGTALAGASFLGISAAAIIGTAVVIGGSLLVSSLTTPDTRQKVQAQQFSTRQSLPARRRAYGRVKLAGPKVEWKATPGSFYNAIYHVEGPIGGYDEFWLDDTKTAIPAGGLGGYSGVAPWNNNTSLEAHLGEDDQPASSFLQRFSWWSANDRLAGCAYSVALHVAPAEADFRKVFPSGTYPEHRVLIRASRVRNINDPAQTSNPASWQWTDNCALCIRDHITHQRWGMKVPESLIDDVSFGVKASIDAGPVPQKGGGTAPRYFLGGAFDLTEQPADVLQGMLDASDATLFLTPEGKIGIIGGIYVAPEVTLRDPQIISSGSIEKGSRKRASFNRLKTSYVSPAHDYQVIEGASWEDLPAQVESGEILEADFARPWVQSHNQLLRLAKIYTAKGNPEWRITGMVTDRSGLPALFESTIRLIIARYGIDSIFTVDRAVASADGSTCTFDFTSLNPNCYSFNPATEEDGIPPQPHASTPSAPPSPPSGLTVAIERRAIGGGVNAAVLVLTCAAPDRFDLSLIGRYRAAGATDWIDMRPDGESRGRVISDVLSDGVVYQPQGAIAGYQKASQSAWTASSPATITATSDNIAPAAPRYTSATLRAFGPNVDHAIKQSSSDNARSVQLLRAVGAGKVLADAAVILTQPEGPNQSDTISDIAALGFNNYWLRAVNASGVVSDVAAGTKTVLNAAQPGNLTQFPNDLTNAVWVKTNVTTALNGTGPDGAPATMISETAVTGAHTIAYRATGLISGGKVRAVWGLKAAGRTNGRLDLIDSNGTGYARFLFDLTAETATVSTASGSIFTGATVSILKVSADFYLVIITASAFTTAVESRLLVYGGPGASSYAGDTTKGLVAWACSLAPVT